MPLQVYSIEMKIYAESKAEADALQAELLEFVRYKREQGVAVTASKFMKAIKSFKNNMFLNNYLIN